MHIGLGKTEIAVRIVGSFLICKVTIGYDTIR